MKISVKSKTVLVGVLKTRRDQKILLEKHWYRIPFCIFQNEILNILLFINR